MWSEDDGDTFDGGAGNDTLIIEDVSQLEVFVT